MVNKDRLRGWVRRETYVVFGLKVLCERRRHDLAPHG